MQQEVPDDNEDDKILLDETYDAMNGEGPHAAAACSLAHDTLSQITEVYIDAVKKKINRSHR